MSDSYPLATKPEDIIPSLVERFNSGEVSNQTAIYAPEAAFIANDGLVDWSIDGKGPDGEHAAPISVNACLEER
jgi:hypothetical protein